MVKNPRCLVLDLEVDTQHEHILHIGAISYQGNTCQQRSAFKSPFALQALAADCGFILGHNLFAHDLRILNQLESPFFKHAPHAIDTLPLSAWLFAEYPYHHLVKDYHLLPHLPPDPVKDADNCWQVFQDALARYLSWPLHKQSLYYHLLSSQAAFAGFFAYLEAMDSLHFDTQSCTTPADLIQAQFQPRICSEVALNPWIEKEPIALAYALALIDTINVHSIHPPWVMHQYPQVSQILWALRGTPCHHPPCSYCNTQLSPRTQLKQWFEFDDFRLQGGQDLQHQAVQAALDQEALMVMFPTGGGKSLSFQLPALIQGEATRSLTVVISPLVALIKDQIDNLEQRFGIRQVASLNGLQSQVERHRNIEAVRSGRAHLLYIAPETLRSRTLRRLLLSRHLARFVIDEAHCFSAWGHDLRVDYQYIGPYMRDLQARKGDGRTLPVSCLTATAKPQVFKDIQTYFQQHLDLSLRTLQASVQRDNLHFEVFRVQQEHEKDLLVLNRLKTRSGPAIVFVATTKKAETLAQKLTVSLGVPVAYFHGKLDPQLKTTVQADFLQGRTDIIVTTSAFGMGVDKDNIHLVIHYHMPGALEAYLQEAGRAGRNPDIHAHCCLLVSEQDINQQFELLRYGKISKKEIEQLWSALRQEGENHLQRSARELALAAKWSEDHPALFTRVRAALAVLEQRGFIARDLNVSTHILNYFTARAVEDINRQLAQSSVLTTENDRLTAKRIFQFLLTQSALKRAEHQSDDFVDFERLCEHLNLDKETVVRLIHSLREMQLLQDSAQAHVTLMYGRKIYTDTLLKMRHYTHILPHLLTLLTPKSQTDAVLHVDLRALSVGIYDQGYIDSDYVSLRRLFELWEAQGLVQLRRQPHNPYVYHLTLTHHWQHLQQAAEAHLQFLNAICDVLYQRGKTAKVKTVAYTLDDLKQDLGLLYGEQRLNDYDQALRQLHHLEVLRLESGLMLFYNRFDLQRLKSSRDRFTKADYQALEAHYIHKVQQIHIMQAYTERMAQDPGQGQAFISDYFAMPFDSFLQHHFPDKTTRENLSRPLTAQQHHRILGELSEAQQAVIEDKKSRAILIAAGPGSGKTRVLVHKVASLLLQEDVQPEQFLMLTFSRPAALEIKQRLAALVGSVAYHLDVFTFHSYAFRLFERKGQLDESEHILDRATQALQQQALPGRGVKHKAFLMIDEYQDVSEKEYAFIQAIMQEADNPRLMVVGDDDQNLYTFRGASVAYMQAFERDYTAQAYYLLDNYRSSPEIVTFAQQLTGQIRQRQKQEQVLHAIHKTPGIVRIHDYHGQHIAAGLLKELKAVIHPEMSTAVLTATNHESLLVQSLLRAEGVSTRLIADVKHFQLKNLLEIRLLSHYLTVYEETDHRLLTDHSWTEALQQVHTQCKGSLNLKLLHDIVALFKRSHPPPHAMVRADWLEFLDELRLEDFTRAAQGEVLISTMHKAKGKEFDHVFVLAERLTLQHDSQWRQLYVACTRAKSFLSLHHNQPALRALSTQADTFEHPWQGQAPQTLYLSCGLKDIHLGSIKGQQKAIQALIAGTPLSIQEMTLHAPGLRLPFSRRLSQDLKTKYVAQGYRLSKAQVRYVVVWYDPQTQKQYRVPLPELQLRRITGAD